MSFGRSGLLLVLASIFLSSFLGGCTSLQSVGVTSIPKERGRPIEVTENNVAFLGIHFDNDFADDVPEELRRKCPNGKVSGVFSKYESTWYVIVQNRSVTVTGYCVTDQEPAAPQAAAMRPGAL